MSSPFDPTAEPFGDQEPAQNRTDPIPLAARLLENGVPPEQMCAVLDAVPHMVWSTRPDGFHDFYNRRWYDYTGVPHGSTDGERWNGMFHPEDQPRAWEKWRHCLATGDPYEIEYRLRHRSGRYRWVLGRALPVRGADGAILRWFGTCTDIDDLKQAETAIELIAGELSHRIGNIFTVVLALLSATVRHRPEAADFARDFADKVHALARAHALVRMPAGMAGKPEENLLALLRALAAPYRQAEGEVFDIAGEDCALGLKAAGALALVVHELATNALKYGALSRPGGRVCVRTAIKDGRLQIDWRESGGPIIAGPPSHVGFGTDMKRRAAVMQLRGRVEEHWLPEGLRVELDFPLETLAG